MMSDADLVSLCLLAIGGSSLVRNPFRSLPICDWVIPFLTLEF